jgi:hypothetical protein
VNDNFPVHTALTHNLGRRPGGWLSSVSIVGSEVGTR